MNAERHPDNASGAWFTNDDCIFCSFCDEIAPETFRKSDDGTHNIVHTQPATEEQIALAEEAQAECPAEAIESTGHIAPISDAETLGLASASG